MTSYYSFAADQGTSPWSHSKLVRSDPEQLELVFRADGHLVAPRSETEVEQGRLALSESFPEQVHFRDARPFLPLGDQALRHLAPPFLRTSHRRRAFLSSPILTRRVKPRKRHAEILVTHDVRHFHHPQSSSGQRDRYMLRRSGGE